MGRQSKGEYPGMDQQASTDRQMETTKVSFFKEGHYTPKRQEVHEDIIRRSLTSLQPAAEQPLVIYLGGGSASGKTSISNMLVQSFQDAREHVLVIDSDKIKTMLPEYDRLLKEDPEKMAQALHDESSDIATRLYEECLKGRVNIILDGTMKSAEKYEGFIKVAREQQYSVSAVIADVPLEEAFKRAEIRYAIEKRRVPEDVIRLSHKSVPDTFKRLENQLDSFYLYDTTQLHPLQFYVKDNGQILVKNEERLNQFYAKADLQKEPVLLKDVIKQVDGMPSIYNDLVLDARVLNREVTNHHVQRVGGHQLLHVQLKGDPQKLMIQMDPVPYLPQKTKNQWIEQAAEGIASNMNPDLGMDLSK
jgi:predicted ABC-type ATPase